MKPTKHLIIASAVLLSIAPLAKSDVTISQGDLLLSFRITDSTDILGGVAGNGTKNLEIGLGAATNYTSGSYFTFSLGADLSALFGSSWNQASTLVWSISGDNASKALWATSPNSNVWNRAARSYQTTVASEIDLEYTGLNGQTATGTGVNGAVVDATQSYSYTSNIGTNGDYGYTSFSGGIEAGVTNSGATSADLYYLAPGSGAGTDRGTFSLDSSGVLTFGTVPEPSTYALAAIGAVGLALIARRRRSLANP